MGYVGNLTTMILDDINAINNLIIYGKESAIHDEWFLSRARARLVALKDDFAEVMSMIGISERVDAGDDVARGMYDYMHEKILRLESEINSATDFRQISDRF